MFESQDHSLLLLFFGSSTVRSFFQFFWLFGWLGNDDAGAVTKDRKTLILASEARK